MPGKRNEAPDNVRESALLAGYCIVFTFSRSVRKHATSAQAFLEQNPFKG